MYDRLRLILYHSNGFEVLEYVYHFLCRLLCS